jgi:hypothetical protein
MITGVIKSIASPVIGDVLTKAGGVGFGRSWSTLTDGTTTIRKYIEDGYLYVDKTLTPLGFGAGSVEGVDWENVRSIDALL